MQITAKHRYAVLIMLDISLHQHQGPVSLGQISERQSISTSYLELLCRKLRESGLVSSVRGPGGGYLINGELQEITVMQIIRAIDEPIKCRKTSTIYHRKQAQGALLSQLLWDELDMVVLKYLNSVTLECMVDPTRQL